MPTTTIRVSTETRETLHQLAQSSGASMQKVLENALEVYRRQQLLEETDAAYAALRDNPAAWEDVEQERRAWDATLSDGLEDVGMAFKTENSSVLNAAKRGEELQQPRNQPAC